MISQTQIQQIREFTRQYLLQTATSSDQPFVKENPRTAEYRWYHTLNVLENTEKIIQGEAIPGDVADAARAAAILHDVSIFECDHAVHGQVSADIAREYLAGENYDPEFIERITRAIVEHGVDFDDFSVDEMADQFSIEGKILIEADILDKLGASAVTNALLWLGRQDHLPAECHVLLSEGRAMQRASYFKDYIWSGTGKRLAEERFAFFHKFLQQLSEEVIASPAGHA